MPYTTEKVSTIVIHVQDIKRSAVFYTETLGLQKKSEENGMVWLSGQDELATQLMLHAADQSQPVSYGIGIELTVDNVQALVQAVEQSTVGKVIQQPIDREWGVREAIIEDPDGYQLWFVQPL